MKNISANIISILIILLMLNACGNEDKLNNVPVGYISLKERVPYNDIKYEHENGKSLLSPDEIGKIHSVHSDGEYIASVYKVNLEKINIDSFVILPNGKLIVVDRKHNEATIIPISEDV